jgi:carboxyl-terminal processing protease
MSPARSWFLLATTLALLVGATGLLVSTALKRVGSASAETVPGESLYREVMERVAREHVDPVDAERAVYGAMKGLVSELDPHSRAFDSAEWIEFERESRGEMTGVGIEVVEIDGDLVIAATAPGSPAAAAGVKPGERLLGIGDRLTKADSAAVLNALEGPKGTRVELLLGGGEGGSERRVEVFRAVFDVATVSVRVLEDAGVAYARISAFRPRTAEAFDRAVRAALAAAPKGLVVDLRFNRGGSFESAVAVADAWLAKGSVVRTRGPGQDDIHSATPDAPFASVPTAVLVNGSTASAAEIVAGALQDTQSAFLIGERTFGKGVIQELIEFDAWPGGMKLTTARTFSPAGRCIDRGVARSPASAGLLPDFVVPLSEADEAAIERSLERESWPTFIRARCGPTPPDRQLAAAIAVLQGRAADALVQADSASPTGRPR